LNVELKLEVWDSPNSAGVVIDALRCAKLAKDAGFGGALLGPSAYFMKSPPVQYTDEQARLMVEEFIAEYRQPGHRWAERAAEPVREARSNGHAEPEPATVRELPRVSEQG